MLQTHTYAPQPITITESAANKIASLMLAEQNPALKLRVHIEGGGCSGLKYGFSFDEAVTAEDFVMTKTLTEPMGDIKEIQLVVDSISYQYLVSAEIDYESSIDGEQFIIRNPNAATTCGCGSSFSVDE
jgi:iron-sulfur cluster insertion protein